MNINLIFIRVLLLNGIIYGSVGFLPWLSPFVLQEMQLDKLITFNPYSIYLYLSMAYGVGVYELLTLTPVGPA